MALKKWLATRSKSSVSREDCLKFRKLGCTKLSNIVLMGVLFIVVMSAVSAVMIYVLGSFASLSLMPCKWSEAVRILCAAMFFFVETCTLFSTIRVGFKAFQCIDGKSQVRVQMNP